MNRPIHVWSVFACCLAVLLAAMGWVSYTAIRLDQAQGEAQRQAAFEEKVRLALWRMDSALAPLIVQESSRPYFTYTAFYAAERAYNRMFNELSKGEVLVPSPLLTQTSTNVLLHFQYGPDGRVTSPHVPTGNSRDLAEGFYLSRANIERAAGRLAELQGLLNQDVLVTACATTLPEVGALVFLGNEQQAQTPQKKGAAQKYVVEQRELNNAEFQNRAQNVQNFQQTISPANDQTPRSGTTGIAEGAVRPIWFGDALVLARRIVVDGRSYIQGCWLDWPNIRKNLLGSVVDLLPNARLEPLRAPAPPNQEGRLLAALPVRLEPGSLPLQMSFAQSPVAFALGVAWVGALLAAVAVGVLLHGIVSLSERRAAFVSAVTHELRTPLTTFKMYSEMLADEMIPDAAKRQQYLQTLVAEANRLTHLVENVLAYARLERSSARARIEHVSLGELLGRVRERLSQRAERASMSLVVDSDSAVLSTRVHVDVAAVEQILFNLVDNACKYAAPTATEKIIHIEALPDGKFAMLRVRDHGQGISGAGARRLFKPFSKSAHEAAHTAPGVGLGLALCRRLSRSMGGDLCFDSLVTTGACFVLTLPICTPDGIGGAPASLT